MDSKTYLRLSVMMFLEFFVWGAWFVTLGTHLGEDLRFTGSQIGYTYLMNNIAAIISPFFVGMIADRYFASQKLMGILHLIGGALMYWSSGISTFSLLIFGLLLYNLTYMPTLALVNAISFRQMEKPEQQFPKVRVWGTVGWIVAGLVITFGLSNYYANVERTAVPLKMAAIASVLLGLYSFTLPNTPPQNAGKKISAGEVLGLKALRLMKQKSFFIFVLCSLLISIPLAFYYSFTNLYLNDLGMQGVAAKQSLGQMSEVGFMILMPVFFARLGVKKMLLVGMLAWVVRYAFFASGNLGPLEWMLYAGILLHGVCYDFFFVTGQIYVDKKASRDIRASAQGFITLVTYGVGLGLGTVVAGYLVEAFTNIDPATKKALYNWKAIWWIPAVFAAAVAVFFAMTFKDREADKSARSLQPQPAQGD
ncbi:MAG TPA: nucleoside permease [Blastocatellia bacterium]|nr:nucleoside permease [Blastocatellia bacterium]